MPSRRFRSFSWKDTNLKVASHFFDEVTAEIVRQRRLLEAFIKTHRDFVTALTPVSLPENAPEVARRMAAAAQQTGLGPMAAVAGTLSQLGVEKALQCGDRDVVVENGGDIFMCIDRPLLVGIYAGPGGLDLAFEVNPADTPLAICSSSGRMGHSLSLGDCDLACAVAEDGALADAAATKLANQIRRAADLQSAVHAVMNTAGLSGVLAVQGGNVALAGCLPELKRHCDAAVEMRITVDRRSKRNGADRPD
jgi:ApbE superfamily uncharacterized protein (UPF0280 family)